MYCASCIIPPYELPVCILLNTYRCTIAYIPYMQLTPNIFHLFLSLIKIYIIATIDIIGLSIVDGDIEVSYIFRYIKLKISNIGHITINVHNNLSNVIFFIVFSRCQLLKLTLLLSQILDYNFL